MFPVVTFFLLIMSPEMERPAIYEKEMTLEECVGTVANVLNRAAQLQKQYRVQAGCSLQVPHVEDH